MIIEAIVSPQGAKPGIYVTDFDPSVNTSHPDIIAAPAGSLFMQYYEIAVDGMQCMPQCKVAYYIKECTPANCPANIRKVWYMDPVAMQAAYEHHKNVSISLDLAPLTPEQWQGSHGAGFLPAA